MISQEFNIKQMLALFVRYDQQSVDFVVFLNEN